MMKYSMMELTWGSDERVGSKMRPRVQETGEGVIVVSSMMSEMSPYLLRVYGLKIVKTILQNKLSFHGEKLVKLIEFSLCYQINH